MKFELCYSASNSNPLPTGVVDWGKNNLICYGSCNAVKIYNPNYGSGGRITNILIKHTNRVNSVKWLSGKEICYETELISGSSDTTVCVWKQIENKYEPVVLGHHSSVNIVEGIQRKDNSTVVISISMDHTAKIWYRSSISATFVLNQTLNFGFHLGLCVKLTTLPKNEELLLFCALDDSKLHIFTETGSESLQFETNTVLGDHEDWIQGLDFTTDGDDLLLATCSQDTFIRLWRLTPKNLGTITVEKNKLKTLSNTFNIYLESVISGHEDWVYSVKWSSNGKQLLSASIDKSMIIWELDQTSELWLEKIRVGEIGGNTLGFYGGLFGPKYDIVLGHSYHGAFHIWKYCEQVLQWVPSVTIGGHFNEVVDCAWEPKGQFLFTASADQTTRIHAPWKRKNEEITWHEIARPQIHGYNMNSIAVISRYQFASAADEKVVRIFTAPINFVENLRGICNIIEDEEHIGKPEKFDPKGASVPSLGLSNKAIYLDNNFEATISPGKNIYPEESHFTATKMTEPPFEESLLQNTLWPEAQKLYGHGYEVYSLAASPDGKYLASACKSTKPEHSAVLLWDTSNWTLIQKLLSHTLTVVQLQFSPNSNHLLSVSRDRRWSLFNKKPNGLFELKATIDKTTPVHSRIIWTCCWTHDSKYFATGSRDGKIAVWSLPEDESFEILGKSKLASEPYIMKDVSVTALTFAPDFIAGKYLLAVGMENGNIELLQWSLEKWEKQSVLFNSAEHHETIVTFAEEHPEIITNKFSGLDGKQKQQWLWEQLMLKLNSLGYGVLSVTEYKRRIVDWKSKVKAKAVDAQKSLSRTGGGEGMLKSLTKIEQRLLAVMGNKSYEDDHNSEMGFSQKPSFKKSLDSVPIQSTSLAPNVYSFPQKSKKMKKNIPPTITCESLCPMLSSNHTSSQLNTDTPNAQYSYEGNSNIELFIEEESHSVEDIAGTDAAPEISKKPSVSTKRRKNLTSMTDSIKQMNTETLNVLKSMDSSLKGINGNLKSINESFKKLSDYIELKF